MRSHSWARSCRLSIQYYPPTSVCCSKPSFSIKQATDLQIYKNGANIWDSIAEPGAVGSVRCPSSIIRPPQSVSLPSFSIKQATDLQILQDGANIWGSDLQKLSQELEAQYPVLSTHLSLFLYPLLVLIPRLTCRISRIVPIYEVP